MADDKVNKQIVELSKISRDDGKEEYAKAQFELGLIYEDKKHNYDKAEEYYSNIFREDAPKFYASAQLNLGYIYEEIKHNYDKAIQFYSLVSREDSPKVYAKAQFNLGYIYDGIKQDYEQAIRFYSNVTKVDGPEPYARAQFNLGYIYDEIKQDYDKAVQFFSNVTRVEVPELYANAQFNIGKIYLEKKQDYDKAIQFYSNVNRIDIPELYAQAQFNIGTIYIEKKQNYDKAIQFYSNVNRIDAPDVYANAQFSIGSIYLEKKQDYDKAVPFYSNVKRIDIPELYAKAQFNLGYIYIEKDYDKAIKLYSNVTIEDAPELYAYAHFNIGSIYIEKKQNYDKAIQFFSNVSRIDVPELYAKAQFNIGTIYLEKIKDYDKAVHFFSNITRDDAPEVYAYAQFNLGTFYLERKQDYDKAIHFYSNAAKEDAPSLYAYVQSRVMFELGNIYLFKKNEPNKFPQYYKKTKYSSFCPDYFIAAQMILQLNNLESWGIDKIKKLAELVIDNIEKICHLANEIKDLLMVSFEKKSSSNETPVSKNPERRVAHYTRPGVLFNLLKGENPSKFRLNIVDFMNDPSENQVLTQWLNISNNQDNEIKTFLASFSFNHNSLNQFRLYGNEDNIHGSGVSIAFSQDFFGQDADRSINSENINISKNLSASFSKNEKLISYPFKSQNNEISNQLKTENEANTSLHPLSLYRCLYFDPKTEYMSLAKRNKQSFYLEMYNEINDTKVIDEEWQNYINDFKEEEQIKTIRVKMNKIKSFIGDLLKHDELNKISNLEQLISLAVLPISCLIKHAAFEDEDECRMIYITNIADDKIVEPTNYQAINSLYVEYTHVENYIDNIYLGPQCKMQHKLWLENHFKKKHNGKEIKLIKSEMPLR